MALHLREIVTTGTVGNYIANEVPSGDINGTNKFYSLAYASVVGTVSVILNGLVQAPNLDYTLIGSIIEFVKAPRPNSEILVNYFKEIT